MKRITQTCGWCKQPVEHSVMSDQMMATGVVKEDLCPGCKASIAPFETPDGVARIDRAGDADKLVGEPRWMAGAAPK